MNNLARRGAIAVVLGLGLLVILLMAASLSPVAADDDVDLTVELQAPSHIADGATYQVRIVYYNLGANSPPDAQVMATLPANADYITSTDRWGDPLPPDGSVGDVLTWAFDSPNCYTPLNANCGHVVLTLQAVEGLADGTELETVASVSTTAVDQDETNNEDSVVSMVGAMAGSRKQVNARQVMPGDVLTYTITLDRDAQMGGSKGDWVTLTDTIPFSHQVRFLGWQGTVTGTVHEGQMLRWQGQVQAGKQVQIQYQLGVEATMTPGMVISNAAMLRWNEQLMLLGPVSTVVTLPHGSLALGPNEGGQTYHRHGVTLTVPPGAISDTTRFQIGPLFTDSRPSEVPPGLFFAHRAFELNAYRFGHHVGQFTQPLTITLKFDADDVPGLKRETIRLWTRSGPEGPWAALGEPARVMSGTVIYTTTHFSQFALFGEGRYGAFLPVISRE